MSSSRARIAAAGTRRERAWHAVLVLVAASLATRLAFARAGFLNVDEATHLLGARTLVDGGRLYVDFADNKPPLVYFFYAAAQWLAGPGVGAVRLIGALVLVPGTALAASAFYGHGRRGLAAGIAFIVASGSLLAADAHAVHCEHVMLLPFAWSLVLLRAPRFRRRWPRVLGAGVLLGLAVLGKQPALTFLLATGLLLLLERGSIAARARSVAVLLLGAALPWALFAGWMWWRGSLEEAGFWIFRFNATHVDNPMPTADQVGRIVLFGSGLLPAMLPLGLALWLDRTSVRPGQGLWLVTLFLAAVAPAILGMRLFGHYFVPAVFVLALAAGPFFARRRPRARHVAVGSFALLCLTVVTAVGLGVHDPSAAIADVSRPSYERIGRILATRTARHEACSLFVWGYAPMIYVYADAPAASRFVAPLDSVSGYLAGNDAAIEGRIDTSSRIRPEHWDALVADLHTHRPCYIVDTAPANLNGWGHFPIARFPRLDAMIARDYRPDGRIEGASVYVRR